MRMKDFAKAYNEMFPRTETKPVEIIETPVGDKVVEKEVDETPVVLDADGGIGDGNNGDDN